MVVMGRGLGSAGGGGCWIIRYEVRRAGNWNGNEIWHGLTEHVVRIIYSMLKAFRILSRPS